ncbi:MAG: HD domain-containing protein [Chloroflexi bacterium]|nr:HD domain-containing protein [Chloroflexota bacterium]
MAAASGVDLIDEMFRSEGMREYLGEPVTLIEHMLQAATIAEAEGAPDELVAAALLHDIGHVRTTTQSGSEDRHAEGGATWLSACFPSSVTEPVRLHVAAKRYLCAVEPEYAAGLSGASTRSLAAQGGAMSRAEVNDFERSPYFSNAVSVRRWDEAAKNPDVQTYPFEHFRPLLERLQIST